MNQKEKDGACMDGEKFPDGTQKTWVNAGSDPNGADTSCTKSTCPEDYHVQNGNCIACPSGYSRPAGDDPKEGSDTICLLPKCNSTQRMECARLYMIPSIEEGCTDGLSTGNDECLIKSVNTWSFLDLAMCINPESSPIISCNLFSIFIWISSYSFLKINFFFFF